jgi:hypothetical protein
VGNNGIGEDGFKGLEEDGHQKISSVTNPAKL